ncbi:hypothetical protein GCM10011348_10930 [Marinobacterium nitratireducens]|uniref:cyclic-guanylate-specific phosphodiesterase n=1 Tax=Marinobacterium nitratireducens TaxID=518897 RepID=A0A918DQG1_9GAMM|nr:EAL domain-containing protein [Marinobacterium nitratireducens]GGO78607.1 hypothetical protein GCM10011348_10930 [Marinobacterium nitratireducens]
MPAAAARVGLCMTALLVPARARAGDWLWQPDVTLLMVGLVILSTTLSALYWYVHRRALLRRIDGLENDIGNLRAAFDAIPYPITLQGPDGRYRDCNESFRQLSGLPAQAVVGQNASDIFPAPVALRIMAQDRLALNGGSPQCDEDWVNFAGQRPRLYSIQRLPLGDDRGLMLLSQDVTRQRQQELGIRLQSITLDCLLRGEALNRVLDRLAAMVEDAYGGIACSVMLLDNEGNLRVAAAPSLSPAFVASVDGLPALEGAGSCGSCAATGRRVLIDDVQTHPWCEGMRELALDAGVSACWSEPVIGSQGEVLGTFCLYSFEIGLPTPAQIALLEQVVRLVCLAVERSRQEEQLRKLSRAVEQSSSMVIIMNERGAIEYVNAEFCEVTGYRLEEVQGQELRLLQGDESDDDTFREMWELLRSGCDWHGELRARKKSGALYWSTLSVSPIVEDDGSVIHFVGISEDISAQKQSQEQIEQLAFYDPLTQLGNRRLFREQLDQELRKVRRSGKQLALFYLDLDNFKQINDTLGHDVGDRLLQAVAERLRQTLRESDIIARLGGDEFIILLPELEGLQQAKRVAEKLLSALLTPIVLGAHEVLITFSIGITLAPEDGDSWAVLMKNADLAMYRAKRQGRDNYQFFTREMNEEVMRRARMEGELRMALEEKQFRLHYQPQWNLLGGLQLVAVEALIRWDHAERGPVSPAEFIPVAEELGLIVPLGHWVIREACRAGKVLFDQGHEVRVAVNLSLRQFRDPLLLDTVRSALDDAGLPARFLEFEITESMIMDDIGRVLEILGALKALGVTLAIDDFGTGYSSLSYLKRLPVDQLKVDASFVRDIPQDRNDMEIAAAVIAMAHKLGLKVVAEGIETHDQLAFLRDNRCEMGQGYLLARPAPLDEVLEMLEVEIAD